MTAATLRALLTSAHPIADADWARAADLAEARGERLALVLTRLGLIGEPELAACLANGLGLRLLDPAELPARALAQPRLMPRFLQAAAMIPLAQTPSRLVLAVVDPLDTDAIAAVGFAVGLEIELRVGCAADIDAAWHRLYAGTHTPARAAPDQTAAQERLGDLASDAPVIRLVNQMIASAVDLRASDIHLEPLPARLRLRVRIDGVLRELADPPAEAAAAMISRLKVMARLNIAEHRLPQDGRIRLAVRGRDIDLRVATTPGVHGEGMVLRVLNQMQVALDFAAMGMEPPLAARLEALLDRPHGIILATGPTGSGKTTTLYAALARLNQIERKILTIEDPIEYLLPGVSQLQIRPQIGLGFAPALRAFLRQDPDVMMVGEIRDNETAEVAAQAALTGHLILSTLHTNSAAAAVTRLFDLGLAEYLVAETLRGVLAQRLVRRCCDACTPRSMSGCARCGGSGFFGRTAIMEIMPITAPIRGLILQRADATRIEAQAIAEGMVSMHAHGLEKLARGQTTAQELQRATG